MEEVVLVVSATQRMTFVMSAELLVEAVREFIELGLISSVEGIAELKKLLPKEEETDSSFIDLFRAFEKHCPPEMAPPVFKQVSSGHFFGSISHERIFLSPKISPFVDKYQLDTFVVDPIELVHLKMEHPGAWDVKDEKNELLGLVLDKNVNINFATDGPNGNCSLWQFRIK